MLDDIALLLSRMTGRGCRNLMNYVEVWNLWELCGNHTRSSDRKGTKGKLNIK